MHIASQSLVAAIALIAGLTAGHLQAGANWQLQPYNLALPAAIAGRGQVTSGSLVLTLAHDTPCAINISVAQDGNQLRGGASSLATAYKLTGPAIQNPDATWIDSAAFVGHNYSVLGVGPVDQVTLFARGTAPSDSAPDAGAYSASLVLTVSW